MAIAQPSALISSISGKVGGVVFRNTSKGISVSSMPSTRRATIGGSGVQAELMSSDILSWSGLSTSQRAGWAVVAQASGYPVRRAWIQGRQWGRITEGMTEWPVVTQGALYSTWRAVAVADIWPIYVAVASTGAYSVMSSPDGIHWTARTAPEANSWNAVCLAYGAAKFIAVASTGTYRVMTSYDGITWDSATAAGTASWQSVAWSQDQRLAVAVSDSGDYQVMTSEDGVTWNGVVVPDTYGWSGVCYSPELDLWVAVAYTGVYRIMYSSDGASWTPVVAPEANEWISVCWAKGLGLFVAVAQTGTHRVMYSANGADWSTATASDEAAWRSIVWCDTIGILVAAAPSGTAQIMTSADGITWESSAMDASFQPYGLVWSDWYAQVVGVGWKLGGGTLVSPITLRPTRDDGTPLLVDHSGVDGLYVENSPTMSLAAPLPEDWVWHHSTIGTGTLIWIQIEGELTSGASQTYLALWFGRPLGPAEMTYRGTYKYAGIIQLAEGSWTTDEVSYPWHYGLATGARIPVSARYISRGMRASRRVDFTITLTD